MISSPNNSPESELKIFIMGSGNSGKSSFLNAINGSFVSETSGPMDNKNLSYDQIKELSDNLINIIDTFKTELLIKGTLKSYKLYDFPNFASKHETKNMFYNKILSHVGLANVVLYLVDSTKILDQNEVDHFQRIKNVVNYLAMEGTFIRLLVVLNKFDILQDVSLSKVKQNVSELFGINILDVYRISCHKMLISNVKKNSRVVHIPCAFKSNEIRHILSNANVSITRDLISSITKSRIIHGRDILYSLNLLIDDKTNEEELNTGDYDQLLVRLETIRITLIDDETSTTKFWIKSVIDKIKTVTEKDVDLFISSKLYPIFETLDKKVSEGTINNCRDELIIYLVNEIKNKSSHLDNDNDQPTQMLLKFVIRAKIYECALVTKSLFEIIEKLVVHYYELSSNPMSPLTVSDDAFHDEPNNTHMELLELLLSRFVLNLGDIEILLNIFSEVIVWSSKYIKSIVNNKLIVELNGDFCYCLTLALVPTTALRLIDRLGQIDYSRIRNLSQRVYYNLLINLVVKSKTNEVLSSKPSNESLFRVNTSILSNQFTVLLLNYDQQLIG